MGEPTVGFAADLEGSFVEGAVPIDIGRTLLVGKVCSGVAELFVLPKKKLLNEVAIDDALEDIG